MANEKEFTGEFKHSIDPKNRMFLPSSMREDMGDEIVIVKGIDPCVAVYPIDEWHAFTEKLNQLPEIKVRKVKRTLFASACRTKLDSQGRILLPQNLKTYASLEKNVYVIGVGNHAEIWDEAAWEKENSINSDEIVETLVELGF